MKKLLLIIVAVAGVFTTYTASATSTSESPVSSPAPASTVLDQDRVIKGRVVDANNESLAGALVKVNGEKIYTDLDGFFTLKLQQEGIAEVSMISYKSSFVKLSKQPQREMKIVLEQ